MNIELKYKKSYKEAKKHLKKLKVAFEILKSENSLPLDREKIEVILNDKYLTAFFDQIVYRYSKLQGILSKLIRSYLYLKCENVENLTMIDVLNKAEKFNIGINKEKWFELKELRNTLVHNYEDEKNKIS